MSAVLAGLSDAVEHPLSPATIDKHTESRTNLILKRYQESFSLTKLAEESGKPSVDALD
jgi:hypothetical protein